MKKIVLLIITLFTFMSLQVSAKENRLYFTESDDKLYYENELLNEDVFLKHLDMVPGKVFNDELVIENGTNEAYILYFKVIPKEQSSDADLLLDNINIEILLDGKLIYNGPVSSSDLQEAIELGKIKAKNSSKMIVKTTLDEDYSNTLFNDLTYVDWAFSAQQSVDDEPVEIIPSPNTMKNSFPYTLVLSVLIVLIGIGVVFSAYQKKN